MVEDEIFKQIELSKQYENDKEFMTKHDEYVTVRRKVTVKRFFLGLSAFPMAILWFISSLVISVFIYIIFVLTIIQSVTFNALLKGIEILSMQPLTILGLIVFLTMIPIMVSYLILVAITIYTTGVEERERYKSEKKYLMY